MKIDCAQGSILGQRLFTLYVGVLMKAINGGEIVTYVDDSYAIVNGKSLAEVQEKISTIRKNHTKFLKRNMNVCK